MRFRMIGRSAVLLAWTVVPGVLLAQGITTPLPSCNGLVEFDGRYYELVAHNGINWEAARGFASGRCFSGDQEQPATGEVGQPECAGRVQGHLATITSAAEDVFVERLRQCARNRPTNRLTRQEVWVGGVQDEGCTPQPGCGWQWINDEGAISTPQVPLPSYSNWLNDEPNNLGGERHLGIGLGGAFGWNDERALGNIGGYIIEYDTSSNISVIQCTDDGTEQSGCQTTLGQILRLPAEVNPDGSIGVRTYEFTDPRVATDTCGKNYLKLFTERGASRELIIPAYLCGSPRFLVVEVETENIQILQGTVLVENDPTAALPGNWYDCYGINPHSIPSVPPLSGDPQGRDVVGWQTTNPAGMRENGPLAGSIDDQFVGALGEFTFDCGSSRGLTRTASYFVIGLHINFGTTQQEDVIGRFVALTRYKLRLLQASVEASRSTVSNATVLRTHLTNALRFHDRGQYASALNSINVFLEKVGEVTYTPTADNFNGEHLSRARNIAFMYEEKVIPFTP